MVLISRRWTQKDAGMALFRPVLLLLLGATAVDLGIQTAIASNDAAGWTGTSRRNRLEQRREQTDLVKLISTLPGPVVSENMTLLLKAGKSVPFEPDILKYNTDTGRFDEGPLIKRISDKFFDAIVLYTGTVRFTPRVREAIHRNYQTYKFDSRTYTVYVR